MRGGAEGAQHCLPLGLAWWPQDKSSDRRWGQKALQRMAGVQHPGEPCLSLPLPGGPPARSRESSLQVPALGSGKNKLARLQGPKCQAPVPFLPKGAICVPVAVAGPSGVLGRQEGPLFPASTSPKPAEHAGEDCPSSHPAADHTINSQHFPSPFPDPAPSRKPLRTWPEPPPSFPIQDLSGWRGLGDASETKLLQTNASLCHQRVRPLIQV